MPREVPLRAREVSSRGQDPWKSAHSIHRVFQHSEQMALRGRSCTVQRGIALAACGCMKPPLRVRSAVRPCVRAAVPQPHPSQPSETPSHDPDQDPTPEPETPSREPNQPPVDSPETPPTEPLPIPVTDPPLNPEQAPYIARREAGHQSRGRPWLRAQASTAALAVALLAVATTPASAQYFGQNKVQYDTFDFRILQTDHFDIYYYPTEADAARNVARMAERWYVRLSEGMIHALSGRQVVVLYGSHPEFEQTNVIEGLISEGTGGVTEGGQRRVVLPLAASLRDTDHVLGHELVHAFQYDILGNNTEAVPLWFIEGMAEYFSLGARDPQTAMWLRDAAIEDRLPTVRDLYDPRYFPYRFGQAFWAYVGGRWGDRTVATILHNLGGPRSAGAADPIAVIEAATGLKQADLSRQWHDAIREQYHVTARAKGEDAPVPAGQRLLSRRESEPGGFEVGPALSPDGRRIAFLSSRNRLAIDLFVADAADGKNVRQLTRSAVDPHFESLQFLASAGSWSPDNRQLVVGAVRKGRAVLAIFDVDRGDLVREIPFELRGEIFNPAWSPDGRQIAFAAQVGGFTDLYLTDVQSGRTRALMHDPFADLHPSWSPDGSRLLFVTERFTSTLDTLQGGPYRLGVFDVQSGAITAFETMMAGEITNAVWTDAGRSVAFISDSSGRPEVYRQSVADPGQAAIITREITGVTGITPLSAALSSTTDGRTLAFSAFRNSGYEIRLHSTDPAVSSSATPAAAIDDTSAVNLATLPPVSRAASAVADLRQRPNTGLPSAQTFSEQPYSPKLSLLGVGQEIGVGAGGSSAFGTYISGGVSLLFSDVLGRHIVPTSFSINGRPKDIGLQAAYINRSRRWNWGFFGERAPLVSGTVDAAIEPNGGQPLYVETTTLFRQTASELGVLAAYPFSRAVRLEFTSSLQHIGFGQEREQLTFDAVTGDFLGRQTFDEISAPGLRLFEATAALVRDTTASGAVGPILGQRFRLEGGPTWGDLRLFNVTTDFRQYAMPKRPVTLALRVLHAGRYGDSSEDERLYPLFLGYSTLVRGYDANSFDGVECSITADGSCPEFDRLIGSRMVVVNGEVRVPVGGLFTGNLDYGPVPAEVFTFFDAGATWTRAARPFIGANGVSQWVRSAGVGVRVNVFGYLVAELNAVKPLDRIGRGWGFQFNLRPSF